jgi:hypothetical protein
MGSKSTTSVTQRELQPEEIALLDTQKQNLEVLTKIAEDSYNLSQEDRSYYEQVFRDGNDTQAKEALAKLQSQITGQPVDPASIQNVSIDTLLRDTILTAVPEFKDAATKFIDTNNQLTQKYGTELTGLSQSFSKGVQDISKNYADELQQIKDATGTINQDVLSRETGAAQAGISQSFAEARKQMSAEMARRGLAGSGVDLGMLGNLYQQEALAKGTAGYTARQSALGISEQMRQTQANLAGQQAQALTAGATAGFQAESQGLQSVYGTTMQNALQGYQQSQAATLQGIQGLQQVAQAGQGIYTGSQNYLGLGTSAAGSAASTAGSTAANLNMSSTTTQTSPFDFAGMAQGVGGLLTGYAAVKK